MVPHDRTTHTQSAISSFHWRQIESHTSHAHTHTCMDEGRNGRNRANGANIELGKRRKLRNATSSGARVNFDLMSIANCSISHVGKKKANERAMCHSPNESVWVHTPHHIHSSIRPFWRLLHQTTLSSDWIRAKTVQNGKRHLHALGTNVNVGS